jgi:hypothetical protein
MIKVKITLTNILLSCFLISYSQDILKKDSIKEYKLKTITVTGQLEIRANNLYQYDMSQAKGLVTLLGEPDPIKYISTLPGVSQGMESSMGYYVRGGGSGTSRMELDGVPVYGSTHLFGIFSVFDPDIVDCITFRDGGFTAMSGDYLSSVINVSTPQSPQRKRHISLSPLMSNASLQGTLGKGHALSYVASLRTSLLPIEYALIKSSTGLKDDFKPDISDILLKLNYKKTSDILSVSGYISRDQMKYDNHDDYALGVKWGNAIARMKWEHRFNAFTILRNVAYYSHFYTSQWYKFTEKDTSNIQSFSRQRMESAVNEASFHSDLNLTDGSFNTNWGIQETFQFFKPQTVTYINGALNAKYGSQNFNSNIMAFYGQIIWDNPIAKFTFGGRGNFYNTSKYKNFSMDIHFMAERNLWKKVSLNISVDQVHQFRHVLEGLPIGWALDMTVPSTKQCKPEFSRQIYTGVNKRFGNYGFAFGGYFKNMKHIQTFCMPVFLLHRNQDWENDVCDSKGKSYGIEFRVEKHSTIFNWDLSYTLSRTDRTCSEINGGESYPFKFDRRHILNFTSQWFVQKSRQQEKFLNFTVNLSSGNKMTIAEGTYEGMNFPDSFLTDMDFAPNMTSRMLMSRINKYSMPTYFRIDVGYTFRKYYKHYIYEFSMGVYNITNRHNPFLFYYKNDRWKKISILPIVPSFNWSFRF